MSQGPEYEKWLEQKLFAANAELKALKAAIATPSTPPTIVAPGQPSQPTAAPATPTVDYSEKDPKTGKYVFSRQGVEASWNQFTKDLWRSERGNR